MKEFYELFTSLKYLNLQEQEIIQKKYITLYENLQKKSSLTSSEKQFIKDYLHLSDLVNQNNELYFKRKASHSSLLDNINGYPLDEYQRKVVLSNEKATLVVAGAGSGKSLTIIGKIVYLVKECHYNPEDILCISFTNDATNNLRNNINKNYNFKIDIYTFHKLALEILKLNNVPFIIAPDHFLEEIIDNFFTSIIPHNKIFIKKLSIILGKNYQSKDIFNLQRLIHTFITLFKANNYSLSYFSYILKRIRYTLNYREYLQNKALLLLIINIYLLYEDELKKEKALDFNDMINRSLEVLKVHGLNKHWRYIIVDEYQDTSLVKFNLLKEIINITNANLLAVGDDFQSIYRFTGCSLQVFLNFTKYFEYAKVFQIINTYRNPQELINVAGSFIMKNKFQQKKVLISQKHLDYPIKICYADDLVRGFKKLLLSLGSNQCKDIMVLGRNNKDITMYIDNSFTKNENIFTYQNINFRYLTIHKSKGLESEVVILINVTDSLTGLPSQIKDEKILKYVNNQKDYYKYEEERRLFYVALTRTKSITYILSPSSHLSVFTKELLKYKKYVEVLK